VTATDVWHNEVGSKVRGVLQFECQNIISVTYAHFQLLTHSCQIFSSWYSAEPIRLTFQI